MDITKPRELKFQAIFEHYKTKEVTFQDWGYIKDGFISPGYITQWNKIGDRQFTGLQDKHGKDIYEGDIFRVEENESQECEQCDGCGWYEGGPTLKTTCEHCNGTGQIDGSDLIYYLVIVWVKEWCMFCTLRVADEYFDYRTGGIKALDEPMFWTYTLEDTNDRRFFLCGNIYQNPELLNYPNTRIAIGAGGI